MGITSRVESEKYKSNDGKGYLEYPRNPVKYSRSELVKMSEPPFLGEQTDEILSEILGYSS